MKYDEELLKDKLRSSYKMFNLANETKTMFDSYKSSEYLGLMFAGKTSVLYLMDDERLKKKIWVTPSSSTKFRVVIHSLRVSAEENLLEKPMDLLDFEVKVAKCDSHLYPGNVGSMLRRRWLRENVFDFDERKETIRLRYPLKEVLVF